VSMDTSRGEVLLDIENSRQTRLRVDDARQLENLREGDRVRARLARRGNDVVVVDLSRY